MDSSGATGRASWWYLWRLVRFQPWFWALNALALILLVLLEMVPGLVARDFFNRLAAKSHAAGGMYAALSWLWWPVAFLMLSALGRAVCLIGLQLTNAPFMFITATLLQKNMLRRVLALPGAGALPDSPGEAISRFRDDVDEMASFMMGFNDMIGLMLFAIVAFVVMVSISVAMTLAVYLPLALIVVVVHIARARIERYRQLSREATGSVTGFIGEVMGAVQAVQVANADERIVDHFRTLNEQRLRTTVRDRVFDQVLRSVFANTVNVGTGVILLLASRSMRSGAFTVGDFALFVYYLGWLSEFTVHTGRMLTAYRQLGISTSRMLTILHGAAPKTLVEHGPVYERGAFPDVPTMPKTEVDRLRHLSIRDLTYRHPGSDRGIQHVSFEITQGSFTVITGRIGSGKTTLLQVLLGLLRPDGGAVLWNGLRVDDPADFFVPPRSSYTPQVPRLFSESLRDNLLLGASAREVDIDAALRLAVFDTDVHGMEHGLDTPVGPRGVRLSGGQIQRAAAARMFVRDAELLVLDDLSSALDVETERTLWERVFARKNATVIAVTHRHTALRLADQIIVLKEGTVEAVGHLDDLLRSCPEMQRLWHDEREVAPLASDGVNTSIGVTR